MLTMEWRECAERPFDPVEPSMTDRVVVVCSVVLAEGGGWFYYYNVSNQMFYREFRREGTSRWYSGTIQF